MVVSSTHVSGTIAGGGGVTGTRYSVFTAVDLASDGAKNLSEVNSAFNTLIREPLQQQIADDYLRNPEEFAKEVASNSGAALQVLFFKMTRSGPVVHGNGFPLRFTEDKEVSIIAPISLDCDVRKTGVCIDVLGQRAVIEKYVSSHPIAGDLVALARRFVSMEIKDKPKIVGGPIHVLMLDASGIHPAIATDSCPGLVN